MKTSIPSDVWEKKKALIARLYKDEEWPLKQVIKQIRTADFNPSETQLRSRLKKWRVTKPSRQIRKKPAGEQEDNDDEEDEDASEEMSPVVTKNNVLNNSNHTGIANIPTPNPTPTTITTTTTSPAAATALVIPTPVSQQSQTDLALPREWYSTDVWQQKQSISQPTVMATQPDAQWTASASVSASSPINPTPEQHQLQPHSAVTPVVTQFPTHTITAYDLSHQQPQPQPQHSPGGTLSPSTIPQNTHVLPSSFVAPAYGIAPISYPQPAPPTPTQWSTGSEYIEPETANPSMAMQPTNWYPTMYDVAKVTAPPPGSANSNGPPYYTRMTPGAMEGFNPVMQQMTSPDFSYQTQAQTQLQQQQQQQPPMAASYQSYDEGVSVRPWRRAMTSHYNPNPECGPIVRVDRQGRQRKPVTDRKRKEDAAPETNITSPTTATTEDEMRMLAQQQQQQQQMAAAYHQPHYIAAGHHPHTLMPHEMYAYAGHEQLVLQRPLGH